MKPVLVAVLICMLLAYPLLFKVRATNSLPVHNLNTGLDYATIQDAIDANETINGQTILVDAGMYNETILINKSVSLVGENSSSTILNAAPPNYDPFDRAMINITASNVQVTGFNITGWYFNKISASQCFNITIRDNMIQSSGSCISLGNVSHSAIERNIVVGGGLEGNNLVNLASCSNCVITNNTIMDACYNGITLGSSHYNVISDNKIFHDNYAIYLYLSTENLILGNNVTGVGTGIVFEMSASHNTVSYNVILNTGNLFWMIKSRENTIFHNSFGMSIYNRVYGWDYYNSGYWNSTSEGNYWSDYNGTDEDQDGIGDFPYSFASGNVDYHPLVGTPQNFTISDYAVQTISNSTISNCHFNGTVIDFYVSGENGTDGFCRIRVPKALTGTDFGVMVNGTEIQYKLLPESNSAYNCLYFTYHHSTQEVIITPEYQTSLLLVVFMVVMLLTVGLQKRSVRITDKEKKIVICVFCRLVCCLVWF